MNIARQKLLLYAVTDRSWLAGETLCQQVESALKGGVTCLQLREKHLAYADFLAEAEQIKPLCRQYDVPFIINDDVALAVACDADGVHIGQGDMNVREARALVGENKIVGVSAKTVAQALRAEADGADYLGVGAAFLTSTKGDAKPIDKSIIKQICQVVSIPVVAIGGIVQDNVAQLAGTGIDGVAVVSAIFAADDIEAASRQLMESVKAIV